MRWQQLVYLEYLGSEALSSGENQIRGLKGGYHGNRLIGIIRNIQVKSQ